MIYTLQTNVNLRMIQAYEQGDQGIMKAEAGTVFALAKVLGWWGEFCLKELFYYFCPMQR